MLVWVLLVYYNSMHAWLVGQPLVGLGINTYYCNYNLL